MQYVTLGQDRTVVILRRERNNLSYCRGYVEAGVREGECSVTCLENGIRMLRGSYYNDKPEGFVTLEREDGSWREGFCLDGRWDGIVREFDDDRNIKELFPSELKNAEIEIV